MPGSTPAPIPVLCDRCRAEGHSGEDPFAAFGALLDFDPVPRRTNRADGWDAETQRAFIAALSLTGSVRAATRAVGRAAFGVDQLLAHPESASFRAAHDEAMAIAADARSRRLAEGIRAVAAGQADWRPPDPPWAHAAARAAPAVPAPAEEDSDAVILQCLEVLLTRYLRKLQAERRCRLAGRIAEADFYIRQVTVLEVALDVTSGNGMEVLKQARLGGFDLLTIAETRMSRMMDELRRGHFDDCGDPPRPAPPRHLFVEHDGFATEPLEGPKRPWPETFNARVEREEKDYARDAQAQVEWEAKARRDYERRRAASPHIDEEPGLAGQPDRAARQD